MTSHISLAQRSSKQAVSPRYGPNTKLRSFWLAKYFNNPFLSNIIIRHATNAPLHAHRAVLASSSRIFDRTFGGQRPYPYRTFHIELPAESDAKAGWAVVFFAYSTSTEDFMRGMTEKGSDAGTWVDVHMMAVMYEMPEMQEVAVWAFGYYWDSLTLMPSVGEIVKVVGKLYTKTTAGGDDRLRRAMMRVCRQNMGNLLGSGEFRKALGRWMVLALDVLEVAGNELEGVVKKEMMKRPEEFEDFWIILEDDVLMERVERVYGRRGGDF